MVYTVSQKLMICLPIFQHLRVKQGNPSSKLLFSLFINGLSIDINSQHCDVKVGIYEINILLYAGYIVLLSQSPENFKIVCMCGGCTKWQIYVSADKVKGHSYFQTA